MRTSRGAGPPSKRSRPAGGDEEEAENVEPAAAAPSGVVRYGSGSVNAAALHAVRKPFKVRTAWGRVRRPRKGALCWG